MLAFDRMGSGIPMVLVHAFPLTRRMWASDLPVFARNFQPISIDLPGFGESRPFDGAPTIEKMADALMETLDNQGINQKVIVAGVSMGGYVLFPILRKFANRIRAMVFISTRSDPDTMEARERRFKTIESVERDGLASLSEKMIPNLFGVSSLEAKLQAVTDVNDMISKANSKGVCDALRAMADREDSTPLLPRVPVPVLVVAGSEDSVVPPAEMANMAKKIPQSEFHIIEKAGHLLTLERPEEFRNIFLKFLKRRVL